MDLPVGHTIDALVGAPGTVPLQVCCPEGFAGCQGLEDKDEETTTWD